MTTAAPASSESFAALFEESLQRQEMRSGELITAEVVSVDSDVVIVNAGLKSESVIDANEFKNDLGEIEVQPGDFVSVCIEAMEDGYGSTKLSREKAKRMAAWNDLDKAMEEGTLVSGVISGSVKGKTPVNPIQVTQAFSNNPDDRPYQDVGFDGLDDAGERRKKSYVLDRLANNFGTGSEVYKKTYDDPASDNYKWYRDATFDQAGTGILGRYKNYNNPQGNSPVATTNGQFTSAATLYPDNEDLNRHNTLNENESYYEYEIPIAPGYGCRHFSLYHR